MGYIKEVGLSDSDMKEFWTSLSNVAKGGLNETLCTSYL